MRYRSKLVILMILIISILLFENISLSIEVDVDSTDEWRDPEIEALLEKVAKDKGIPPIILKAVAFTESCWNQNVEPREEAKGYSYGIMQIYAAEHETYDEERLNSDIEYNIKAGAEILMAKWNEMPKIGDANILDPKSWYFALWGYNGWSKRNNPNNMPYYKDGEVWRYIAYQEKVFENALRLFDVCIPTIDPILLPKIDVPNKYTNEYTNDFIEDSFIKNTYKKGDIIVIYNSGVGYLNLRDENGENPIRVFPQTAFEVISDKQEKREINDNMYLVCNVRTIEAEPKEGWVALKFTQKLGITDFNKDNVTDIFDMIKLSKKIDTNFTFDNENKYLDLNYDSTIDKIDLIMTKINYNK